ncbi:hypothetical protein [Streptomyces sp. NPDC002588]|uniref:hypothetical protein n=1 Tax=Streptomyces sp. NPDC002588 TaxID=3154419 RepID=UPI003327933E
MGMYLVSVSTEDWSVAGEDGHGDLATALRAELARRGLPPYEPKDPGAPGWFEEKLSPPMDGFDDLCRARLTEEERHTLLDWSLLVPFALDEEVLLPVGSAYTDETLVVGAPRVLPLAERLAGALGLPLDLIPANSGNPVPRQATFAPSRRPAPTPAAPAESPSTSSTRASGRHAGSTHRTPLLDGRTLPARALELTFWFLEGEAEQAAATRPGPWADDLATAFYTALYLRAAQYSLRHGCPMTYC